MNLDFCHSLKEGKGLLIIKTLIEGEYSDYIDQRAAVQHAIDEQIKLKNIAAIDTQITVYYHKKYFVFLTINRRSLPTLLAMLL